MTARTVDLRDTRHDSTKALVALSASMGEEAARNWAEKRWGNRAPRNIVRSATASVLSSEIGSGTAYEDPALFGAIRNRASLFRIGARRIGFQTRTITGGHVAAAEVGQGEAMPAVKPSFMLGGFARRKFGGLVVVTKEALEAEPGVETLIFDGLTQALADKLDEAFLTPATVGSITNGVTPIPATSDMAADLRALVADFQGDLGRAYFVLSPELAVAISAAKVEPDLGARGGDLFGVPCVVTRGAPAGQITLVDGAGIVAAWDEESHIASSQQAAVEADNEPDGDSTTPTGTSLISLFQANLWSFRGLVYANWSRTRPGSVSVLTGATWEAES